jgi:hypothetical protein
MRPSEQYSLTSGKVDLIRRFVTISHSSVSTTLEPYQRKIHEAQSRGSTARPLRASRPRLRGKGLEPFPPLYRTALPGSD